MDSSTNLNFAKVLIVKELKAREYKRFEDIKQIRVDGTEFWSARELAPALEYTKWENFQNVIKRAMIACENSGHSVEDDFPEVRKIVDAGITSKPVKDYELTRYACYLIVQNGDPRKEVIAWKNYGEKQMELLFEILFELIVGGCIEGSTDKKLPKRARIGFLFFATLIYIGLVAVVIWLLCTTESIIGKVLAAVVLLIFVGGIIGLWYKVLKARK